MGEIVCSKRPDGEDGGRRTNRLSSQESVAEKVRGAIVWAIGGSRVGKSERRVGVEVWYSEWCVECRPDVSEGRCCRRRKRV